MHSFPRRNDLRKAGIRQKDKERQIDAAPVSPLVCYLGFDVATRWYGGHLLRLPGLPLLLLKAHYLTALEPTYPPPKGSLRDPLLPCIGRDCCAA